MIMLAGQLEVEMETDETLILSAGDTLFVRGNTTHRWRQIGRAKCRMLTVLHAPQAGAARDGMLDVLTRQPESAKTPAKPRQ
jgi:quercetin dioxygenase-like cupin family protein